jgi:hypothetical protein
MTDLARAVQRLGVRVTDWRRFVSTDIAAPAPHPPAPAVTLSAAAGG